MKNHVTKFNLEEAFKALDNLTYADSGKGLVARSENLAECYKRANGKLAIEALLEDYYDLEDAKDVENAVQAREDDIARAKLTRIEKIIDLDAKSPADLLPSYVGKIIVQCPQCMNLFYKNSEDVEVDTNDPTTCNANEPCQHCGNTSGYTIIGKVGAVEEPESVSSDSEQLAKSEESSDEANNEETELQNPEEQEESADEETEAEESTEEESNSEEDESDELEDLDINLESFGLVDGNSLREDIDEDSEAEGQNLTADDDLHESVASDLAAFEASLTAPDYQISEDLEDNSEIQARRGTMRQPTNAEFKQMLKSKVWQDFAEDINNAHLHESVASDLAAFEASLDEDIESRQDVRKKESNLDEAVAITIGVDEIEDKVMAHNSCDSMIISQPNATKVYMHPELIGAEEDSDDEDLTELGESPIQDDDVPLTEGILDLLKRKAGDVASALKKVSLKFGAQKTLDNALKSYSIHTGPGTDKTCTSLSDALNFAEQSSKIATNKNKPIIVSGITDKGKKLDSLVVYTNGKVTRDNIQAMIQSLKAEAKTEDSGSAQEPSVNNDQAAEPTETKTSPADEAKAENSGADITSKKVQPAVAEKIDSIKEKLAAVLDVNNLASIQFKDNPTLNDSFIDLKRAILQPKATFSWEAKDETDHLEQLYGQFRDNYIAYTSARANKVQTATKSEKRATTNKANSNTSITSTTAEKLVKSLRKEINNHNTDLDWLSKTAAALDKIETVAADNASNPGQSHGLKASLTPADIHEMRQTVAEALAKCAQGKLESMCECDDKSINNCITQTLKDVYTNVKAFQMTNCALTGNKLIIEGLITFNSGKTRHTEYQFNNANYESKKLTLIGLNEAFGRDSHFKLSCKIDNTVLIAEQLSYNYKINNTIVEGLADSNK